MSHFTGGPHVFYTHRGYMQAGVTLLQPRLPGAGKMWLERRLERPQALSMGDKRNSQEDTSAAVMLHWKWHRRVHCTGWAPSCWVAALTLHTIWNWQNCTPTQVRLASILSRGWHHAQESLVFKSWTSLLSGFRHIWGVKGLFPWSCDTQL